MDINLITTHGHGSPAVQLAIVFIMVYGLWCLVTILRRRSTKPGFLALMPLFVTVPVAWWSYLNAMEGLAIADLERGRRPAWVNVGFEEAILTLGVGALATTALATVALLRGPRQGTSLAASAVAVAVIAALTGITLWYGTYAYEVLPTRYEAIAHPLVGSIGTAVAIAAYLLFAWRRQFYPSAFAVTAAAALATLVVRYQIEIYRQMAMPG